MTTIVLTGWQPGFDKVGLNKLLRTQFDYSLGSAKLAVDAILESHEMKLSVPSAQLTDVLEKLTALCVTYTVFGE